MPLLKTIDSVADKLRRYEGSSICDEISPLDAMFQTGVPGAREHYFSVGRSAVGLIARAMLCTGRTEFESILDLPSGAGRVTRHLRTLFPDARLFVAELDKKQRAFAAETFCAEQFETTADFGAAPGRQFDLIFVGSLVTHFNATLFKRAIWWLTHALADAGVLILTSHGRRHDWIERQLHRYVDPAMWDAAAGAVRYTGFGYVETEKIGNLSYGVSWSTPAWLADAIAEQPSLMIANFSEAAWDNHQDVLIVQKKNITGNYG